MATAVVVSYALMLLVLVLVPVYVCILCWRDFRAGIIRSAAVSGLSPEDLEKLPCYEYEAGEKCGAGGDHVDCAICLESFQVGERCRLLPACKHSFHSDCVDSWLLRTAVCPLCRTRADQRQGVGGMSGSV